MPSGPITGQLTGPVTGEVGAYPWAGAGATLAFHALDDNGAGNFGGIITGAGSLTSTHASTIYAQESSGQWNTFTANKPVVSGGVYTDEDNVTNTSTTYLDYVPAATNSQIQSSDLTNVEWTATTMTTALDATGLDGGANKASTLTATGGNSTVLANAVTAASATHASLWFIKRKTGTGVIELTVDGGTTWQAITITSSFAAFAVDQATVTNPQIGIRLVTSGDAVIVGNAESHLNKDVANIEGLPPIFTVAAAVSTDRIKYYPQLGQNGENTSSCWYLEIVNTTSYSNVNQIRPLPGNRSVFLSSGRQIQVTDTAPTTINKTSILPTTPSTLKYGLSYSGSDFGFTYSTGVQGVWTEGAFGGTMTALADVNELFANAISVDSVFRMRNLRRYDISSYAEGKTKIDELMI